MDVETRIEELLSENRKQDANKLARAVINSHGVESVGLLSNPESVVVTSGPFKGRHSYKVVDGEAVVDEEGYYRLKDGEIDFGVQFHSFPNDEKKRPIRAAKTIVEGTDANAESEDDQNQHSDSLSELSISFGR